MTGLAPTMTGSRSQEPSARRRCVRTDRSLWCRVHAVMSSSEPVSWIDALLWSSGSAAAEIHDSPVARRQVELGQQHRAGERVRGTGAGDP